MIAGGISINGLGKLMLLNGTENEFCYAQLILNYKNDIEELKGNGENYFRARRRPSAYK